jgi:hypothetical protein
MDHEPTPKQCEEAAAQALEAIRDVMDAEGIDGRYLSKKLKRELNAKKTETFKGKVLKRGPEDKIIEVEEVIYSTPMVDWQTRQKARQDAHKLRGDYPAEKLEHSGPGGTPLTPKRIEVVLVKPGDNGNSAL